MIETKYSTADVFDDAVHATAYIATVHVREGELGLPERIRAHLADGPVVVHLMRGHDDVAVHEATLTSRSTLTGIVWPADVKPKTSLTVLCPRGGASHDIGVRLPDLPAANVDWPDDDLPATPQPEPAAEPEQDDEPAADEPEPLSDREVDALAFILGELGAAEQPPAVTALPGPADYEVPTALAPSAQDDAEDWRQLDVDVIRENDGAVSGELELPTDPWPAAEDLAAGETTEVFTAVLVPAGPDPTEGDVEPGTVFSAALVAVRTPPPPRPERGWLERRVRLAARWTLDRSWTATRVVMAAASSLVFVGFGLAYLVQLAVTR